MKIAKLVKTDLYQNTATFEINGEMDMRPGSYRILTNEEYKQLNSET